MEHPMEWIIEIIDYETALNIKLNLVSCFVRKDFKLYELVVQKYLRHH